MILPNLIARTGVAAALLAGTLGFAAPQPVPEAGPEATPQPVPEAGPETVPQAVPEASPEAAPQAESQSESQPELPRSPTGGVTLITGDRVEVTGGGHRVTPGPGREVTFTRQVREGHLHVIPSDARPLIAAGLLDQRLFDVTQLLQWNYGDAGRTDIPLIAQGLDVSGARTSKQITGLGMTALRVPKAETSKTWADLAKRTTTRADAKAKLWLDGRRSFTLDRSVEQIGAKQAWQQGLTGKGVTVAVLDSGYDPDHPELKDVVVASRNFSEDADVRDTLGHGTHVASIVAGAGEKYRGVAPDAKLAVGKVGTAAGPTDSAILAGMRWAALEVKAKIVSMSFGSGDTPDLDPLEQAVNELSEKTGTLFVAGSGNSSDWGAVLSPGSADAALTVGAVDREGKLADFSSQGPREGDHAIKPDLTAPGVEIMAAKLGGGHIAYSGTSMATPHVAGAAAILAQRHPDWTGAQLKAALIGSAKPTPDTTLYEQGAGQADLVRALAQDVTAEPANLWAAFPWDASGDRVATRTITYTNAGDSPVTLDLTTQGQVLSLSAKQVEVPAGGKTSVEVTIDAKDEPTGDHPGTVTATAGTTVVRTLAGAFVEPESYDVTVRALDRKGEPVDAYAQLYDAEKGTVRLLEFAGGVARKRLPEGDYQLYADIAQKGNGITVTHTPVRVDGADQEVTVDARKGVPMRVTLDDPAATQLPGMDIELARGPWSVATLTSRVVKDGLYVVPVRDQSLNFLVRTQWKGFYDLAHEHRGGLPENPVYDVRRQELQTVRTSYRGAGVAAKGTPSSVLRFGDGRLSVLLSWDEVELPGTRTYHRTAGPVWEGGLSVGDSTVTGPSGADDVWNAAVTGPAAPAGGRSGNELTFAAGTLFADGGAGRSGADDAAKGTATLTGDGQELAKAELSQCATANPCELRAELPARAAMYKLSTAMSRQVPYSTLSTEVAATWTFRSAGTSQRRPLPLMAMRYAPEGLDELSRARPGSRTRLPMWTEGPGGAVKAVRLQMSADDGKTWSPVRVRAEGKRWLATLTNPDKAGFVSLRAEVTGKSGTTLTQTITRAYAVG
ncbi:S8 family serine peptidase [Nonomuraea sp. NPDC050404]|uniref:S8 family peptidase n=1 Tax=Nonomuraea sp. NPDC050404 TaxID=3155783 RepID=UPI00340B19BC